MSLASAFSPSVRRRAVVVVAVVVAAFVAASVLFAVIGGFQDARPAEPEPTALGEPFRIGDMEYVVTGVYAADESEGVYLPRDDEGEIDPTVRALVAEVEITNVSETPWLAVTAGAAVHPPAGADIVPDASDRVDGASFFSRDGHLVSVLNPGVTVVGSYGWVQDRAWGGDEVTLTFTDMRWVEEDPLTLDDRHWARTDHAVREVTAPVDDRTGGRR